MPELNMAFKDKKLYKLPFFYEKEATEVKNVTRCKAI